jgi:hypothetical protein
MAQTGVAHWQDTKNRSSEKKDTARIAESAQWGTGKGEKEEFESSPNRELARDLEAGVDAISQFDKANWWAWKKQSTLQQDNRDNWREMAGPSGSKLGCLDISAAHSFPPHIDRTLARKNRPLALFLAGSKHGDSHPRRLV